MTSSFSSALSVLSAAALVDAGSVCTFSALLPPHAVSAHASAVNVNAAVIFLIYFISIYLFFLMPKVFYYKSCVLLMKNILIMF